MGYAFISYSTKNQSSANTLRLILEKNRIESWMAPYDIPIGSRYAQVISTAVKDCACLILLLTDASQNSVWVAKEVERAINYRKTIIPIKLEELVLNEEFELYISTDQIVAIPKIAESEIMDSIIRSIIDHTGQTAGDAKQNADFVTNNKITEKKRTSSKKTQKSKINKEEENKLFQKANEIFEDFIKPQKPIKNDGDHTLYDSLRYEFPSPDLLPLSELNPDLEELEKEVGDVWRRIHDSLAGCNIQVTLKDVERGPSVTRYSLVPALGVRVDRIPRFQDNISFAVGDLIRIEAPIPGKGAVGIEVPNKKLTPVPFRELIENDKFITDQSKTLICIGKFVDGTPIYYDLNLLTHLLIAGATGTGKSMCLKSIITSILFKARPDEVKFILIDPKKVEFYIYNDLPHLLTPVITNINEAIGALIWAVEEMNNRLHILADNGAIKVSDYNNKVEKNPALGKKLPEIVIVIDELADLMIFAKKEIEELILQLTLKGRSLGIHLIISTQRPTVDVITNSIKESIPTKIAFKTVTHPASKLIIDSADAFYLGSNGDMLFKHSAYPLTRIQCGYISDRDITKLVNSIKQNANGASYDKNITAEITQYARNYKLKEGIFINGIDTDFKVDSNFITAVIMTIINGSITSPMLQRAFSIGYANAGKYLTYMKEIGVAKPSRDEKTYIPTVTLEEWISTLEEIL